MEFLLPLAVLFGFLLMFLLVFRITANILMAIGAVLFLVILSGAVFLQVVR